MRAPIYKGPVDEALGPSDLHRKRIEFVLDYIEIVEARRVLDLGCGEGDLLLALASMQQLEQVIGMDVSQHRLGICRAALSSISPSPSAAIELVPGSYADSHVAFSDVDVAVMLESFEHYCPRRLSRIEKTILAGYRPKRLLISTPNKGYDLEQGLSLGIDAMPSTSSSGAKRASKNGRKAWPVERDTRYALKVSGSQTQCGNPQLKSQFLK